MGKGAHGRGLIGPTLAAFAAVAVLVCIVFAFLLDGMSSMKSNADLARRAERVVLLTSRLNRLTVDLETGVRGRLLTGDDRYLTPYRDAQRQIPSVESQLAESSRIRRSASGWRNCASASRAIGRAGRRWPPGCRWT